MSRALLILALAALALFAGPYLDDLDARQATAQTDQDRAAESVQLQADMRFAEARP